MSSYLTPSPDFQKLIEEVIRVSRGSIEAIIVTKSDGTPIANANSIDVNPDYLAASVSAVAGVLSAVLEVMEMGEFTRVNVELSDKRFIFILPYRGDLVALITKPSPNVGLINIILDLYFNEGRENV